MNLYGQNSFFYSGGKLNRDRNVINPPYTNDTSGNVIFETNHVEGNFNIINDGNTTVRGTGNIFNDIRN